MSDSRKAILESFHKARAVPLMHLVKQFLTPGKTSQPADQKADVTTPLLSQNEAFDRLFNRLAYDSLNNHADQAKFKDYIQQLKSKWGFRLSSNEKVILGLAYRFGRGGVNQDSKAAFEQFKSASDADEKNGYAHALLGRAYQFGFGVNKDPQKAAACFVKAITKAKETAGLAYFLKGITHENRKELALAEQNYLAAIKLNDSKAFNNLAGIYAESKNEEIRAQVANYLKTAIAQGLVTAVSTYAHFYIYPLEAERQYAVTWFQLAAKYESSAGAYNASACLDQSENSSLAAAYRRCAIAIGDYHKAETLADKEFKQLVANDFIVEYDVLYHDAMKGAKTSKLHEVLLQVPEVFVRLWNEDYKNPLHPKMKEQAVNYVLKLKPSDLAAAARASALDAKLSKEEDLKLIKKLANVYGLLAKALLECAEPALKEKAQEFLIAQMDMMSVQALPALSAIKNSATAPVTTPAPSAAPKLAATA